MLRYCTNCQKEYDFPPRAVSGKDDIICPGCGKVVPKNSRRPDQGAEADRSEESIGRFFSVLFHLSYIFYITLAVLGIVGKLTGFLPLLYITALISLGAYGLQCLTRTTAFPSGMFFIPAAAVVGFIIFKDISGSCLSIHIVFLLRHLIRDIFYRLFFYIIRKSNE